MNLEFVLNTGRGVIRQAQTAAIESGHRPDATVNRGTLAAFPTLTWPVH